VRQVLLWLREEHIELPAVLYQSGAWPTWSGSFPSTTPCSRS
jgi:hypothetical protein